MKALSLTQPWAQLVLIGEKQYETRSWGTKYRGPLAIHAAKGFPRWAIELALTEPFRSALARAGVQQLADLPRGAVIAQCRLVDCLPIVGTPLPQSACIAPDDEGLIRVWHPMTLAGVQGHYSDMTTEHEADFGDYTAGRFGWVLTDVKPLPQPIPARGSLGLWEWQLEMVTA